MNVKESAVVQVSFLRSEKERQCNSAAHVQAVVEKAGV
jgi:hypothetical protein